MIIKLVHKTIIINIITEGGITTTTALWFSFSSFINFILLPTYNTYIGHIETVVRLVWTTKWRLMLRGFPCVCSVCSKGEEKVFKRRFTKGVNLYTEGNCVVVIVLTHSYIDTQHASTYLLCYSDKKETWMEEQWCL